jgi:hypothetical protein
MRSLIVLFVTFLAYQSNAFAETALLCGENLDLIVEDNPKAEVHVDFDHDTVKNKNDVKFFSVFGKKQRLISAKTFKKEFILIETQNETYLLHNPNFYGCSDETKLGVIIGATKRKLECACFQD